MAEYRSIKEQLTQMTQEEEDSLGRIGIVLHGTKAIAEYMGVSPASISRWRTRYRGRQETRLCFPAMLTPTGKGWGFRMIAHTGSIQKWIERWAEIDAAKLRDKNRWRRTPKVKRLGETNKGPGVPIERESGQTLREDPSSSPVELCDEPFKGDRGLTVHQEPPARVETQPGASATELPGPPVNPRAPRRQSGSQRPEGCTCGTSLTCHAHDEPS